MGVHYAGMQNPANLEVWHRAMDLAVGIHAVARRIEGRKAPGLATQLRRAAASIPANIAEGVGQPSPGLVARHLAVAIGSNFEVETHLLLAMRLCPAIGTCESTLDELRQIRRMLFGLRRHYLSKPANVDDQVYRSPP